MKRSIVSVLLAAGFLSSVNAHAMPLDKRFTEAMAAQERSQQYMGRVKFPMGDDVITIVYTTPAFEYGVVNPSNPSTAKIPDGRSAFFVTIEQLKGPNSLVEGIGYMKLYLVDCSKNKFTSAFVWVKSNWKGPGEEMPVRRTKDDFAAAVPAEPTRAEDVKIVDYICKR